MSEKQHITLRIGAHNLPLTVNREDEPVYRDACARLNAAFDRYAAAYKSDSEADLWVKVALTMAVNLQSDAREKAVEPLLQTVREINKQIEETLNNQ